MQLSTPPGDSRTDLTNNPRGIHGDVDKNGDLVDELTERLRDNICADHPELAECQLRCVREVVQRRRGRLA